MRICIHPQLRRFRLIPHWNQTGRLGSLRIGIKLVFQAHRALDNSPARSVLAFMIYCLNLAPEKRSFVETAAVLGYMRKHNFVGADWIAEYIANVTNAFILVALLPGEAPGVVESFIIYLAREQQLGYPIRAESVQAELYSRLEELNPIFRNGPPKIPLPKNKSPLGDEELANRLEEEDRNKHRAEIERYSSRSRNAQFADRLAMAAKEMERMVSLGAWRGGGKDNRRRREPFRHLA